MYQDDLIKEEKYDIVSLFILFRYARNSVWLLTFSVGMVLVSTALLMISAKLLGDLVEVLRDPAETGLLWKLVAIIIFCEVVFVLIRYIGSYGLYFVTNKIVLEIRKDLFRKLTLLPAGYFDRQPLGRTITRLTNDVEGIENFFSGSLSRFVSAIINIAAVFAAMILTDLYFGLAVTLASVPAMAFVLLSRSPVRYWLREYKKRNAIVNARLAEYISGISIIRIFGLEDWSYRQFNQLALSLRNSGYRITNWNTFIRPMAAFLCALPLLVTLWVGGSWVLGGTLSIGIVVAFVRYCERFYWPIMLVTNEIHVIQEAFVSSERIRQMLGEEEETQVLGRDGTHHAVIGGDIVFDGVSMRYLKDTPVLIDVSFSVQQGQSIGLVGKTGSGKTTTANLIASLYPIEKGTITIDGVALQKWSRESIRQQVGMVSQDVAIFKDTVRFNLIAVCPNRDTITDSQVLEACAQTGFLEIISRMPNGLNTILVESGDNLSMGERQLLAITRMLLRNPRILLLDEATANIDHETEVLIKQAVRKVMQGRTCFLIAHRLHTVEHCDKILVFEQGRIIEQGSHSDLLENRGRYASLYERQSVLELSSY